MGVGAGSGWVGTSSDERLCVGTTMSSGFWVPTVNAEGDSFNDGDYDMYINVTDDDIQRHENANPVITLRMRYDAWKADQRGGK